MKTRCARRAVIGAASLLLLAGCGRKGGLETPPKEEESDKNEGPAAESGEAE